MKKNFKCLKCIMSFGYKHHLDRHIKLVHDKELFKYLSEMEKWKKLESMMKIRRVILLAGKLRTEGESLQNWKEKFKVAKKIIRPKSALRKHGRRKISCWEKIIGHCWERKRPPKQHFKERASHSLRKLQAEWLCLGSIDLQITMLSRRNITTFANKPQKEQSPSNRTK